jgi:hypothetical protein
MRPFRLEQTLATDAGLAKPTAAAGTTGQA